LIIQEIDQISITILVDNTTDFLLANSEHAVRPPLVRNERFVLPPLVAEHGFSALITIPGSEHGNNNSFLFDTGVSENGVIHNADIFGVNFGKIDGIVLSHGHFDHFAGLVNIMKRISSSREMGTNKIDVFTHPDAFLRRWEIFPDGKRAKSPVLDEQQLQQLGARIHKNTGVTYLPSRESPLLVITGEISRETSFEKGFPINILKTQVTKKSHTRPINQRRPSISCKYLRQGTSNLNWLWTCRDYKYNKLCQKNNWD
jgi:7,8-dihydropterin-6-yl-methyl-4-(beta-D-ribofuranosyl)aminobenzene 5'-phosphate synthase